MKIHEYQAKAILARYGVTTPRGEVAYTKEEAREAAQRLKSHMVVVKAQIHAGGRGKGGGVKLARSGDEAEDIAGHILGMNLVTPQTGPAGRLVKRVLIEEGLDIKSEIYIGHLFDFLFFFLLPGNLCCRYLVVARYLIDHLVERLVLHLPCIKEW